jgi:hypothetical protein
MKHLYYAAELIEAAGLGEVGVNLFVGTIPADVTEGVMLRDPLVGAELDEGLDGFTQLEFNVIVRSADPAAGYDKALAISRVLRTGQVTRPDLFVLRMAPRTLPVSYPKGDADDIETSVRILIGFKLL